MRLCLAVLLAAVSASLCGADAASADTRTASKTDPRDTERHEQLDGTVRYDSWDIERVSAGYDDTAGTLTLTVRFYDPMPGGFIDQHEYQVGISHDGCFTTEKGDFNVSLDTGEIARPGLDPLLAPTPGFEDLKRSMVWLTELEGDVPYTVQVAADLREFTLTASHPALAGRDYQCVSAGEVGSSWGAGCNTATCWDGGTLTIDRHRSFWLGDPPLPRLTNAATRRYLRTALGRELPRGRHAAVIGCARQTVAKVRCRVAWRSGRMSYKGRGSIWFTRENDGSLMWNYAYTIRRTDRTCRAAGRSGCSRTFRVT